MSQWHHREVSLGLAATPAYGGRRYEVPVHGGESWQHVLTKVAIAAHLLIWDYPWQKIHWEKSPHEAHRQGPERLDEATRAIDLLFDHVWTMDELLSFRVPPKRLG